MGVRKPDVDGSEIEITPEMMRAGVAAYLRWDIEEEEPEALVAEIFFTMMEKRRPLT